MIIRYKLLTLSFAILLPLTCCLAFQLLDADDLINRFSKATDIQKEEIVSEVFGQETVAGGVVVNADEYNFFDEKKDLTAKYYRVTTLPQKTDAGVKYELIFLFKDKLTAEKLTKGEIIEFAGNIIKLVDQRLQIDLWLYCAEITPQEEELFK